MSYNLIPSFSATSLPIYLPPDPYSLAIVITIGVFVFFSSIVLIFAGFSTSALFSFKLLVSFTNKTTANINANPSATGPALNTPIIPYAWLNIIIAGINITICLESDNIALFVLFPIAWKKIPDGIWTPLNIQSNKYVLNAKHANSI